MHSNQKNVNEITNKINQKLPTYEKILVVAALVGLSLKMSGIVFGAMVLTVSLLSLAMLNVIVANSTPKEGSTAFDTFMFKIQSMGSSVTIVGILFLLLNWNGYANMLFVGMIALAITTGFSLNKNQNLGMVLKPIILLIIGLILHFTPKETLHNLHIISNNLIVK